MSEFPSGTITFLFTDIEGSTQLAQLYPDAMPVLLSRHNEILNQAIEACHGFVFRVIGDSFSASLHDANNALRAALERQRLFHNDSWSPTSIKVRMGIHTGTAPWEINSTENQYSGYATLALTQRILSAGHGGQTFALHPPSQALPPAEGDANIHRPMLIARALYMQGKVGLGVGNIPLVMQVLKETIAISRPRGDKQILGYSLGMDCTATTFINAPDGEATAQQVIQLALN